MVIRYGCSSLLSTSSGRQCSTLVSSCTASDHLTPGRLSAARVRLKYVEQELAKRRGVNVGTVVEDKMSAEDELYRVPDHLKVTRDFLTRNPKLDRT